MASGPVLKKVASEGASSESATSESGSEDRLRPSSNSVKTDAHGTSIRSNSSDGERFEYSGWVYHVGVNSIGHEYCHFRFLRIRGRYVEMYKRDPSEHPGIKPIRRGVIGHTLMVEELGRRKVHHGDVYVLRFYNRLETKKGEIACNTAGDARKWMEAFDHAKQQAEYELSRGGSVRNKLNMEDEINLEGHRPRVRRYAHGLKKLIRIGQGPEVLLRKASSLGTDGRLDAYFDADGGDVVEAHEWKCVRTVNVVACKVGTEEEEIHKDKFKVNGVVIGTTRKEYLKVCSMMCRTCRFKMDLGMELEVLSDVSGHMDSKNKWKCELAHGHLQIMKLGKSSSNLSLLAIIGLITQVHRWFKLDGIVCIDMFVNYGGNMESDKGVLVKAVGVVDASADTVFEVVLNPDRHRRYEWDTLTGDLELVDSVNGHFDVVYGTFDPRYFTWRQSRRDFVFSRQWVRGQDGTYTILQFPSVHKKRPPRSGYKRTKINPSTWEISNLSTSSPSNTARCLVTQTLEISPKGWFKWRNKHCQKFEKSVPYALLSQVSGLKEYIGANPALTSESSTTIIHSKVSDFSGSNSEFEDAEGADEFYDAIAGDSSSSDEDSDNEIEVNK
ncbi:UNVERIFIED_CONTAM: protein ENHANCED DISEASE RESISTANCE 2-like, partial [Sesamum calycinum]